MKFTSNSGGIYPKAGRFRPKMLLRLDVIYAILLQPKAEDGQKLRTTFLPYIVERLQQTVAFVDASEPQRQLPVLLEGRAALYPSLGKRDGGVEAAEVQHDVVLLSAVGQRQRRGVYVNRPSHLPGLRFLHKRIAARQSPVGQGAERLAQFGSFVTRASRLMGKPLNMTVCSVRLLMLKVMSSIFSRFSSEVCVSVYTML